MYSLSLQRSYVMQQEILILSIIFGLLAVVLGVFIIINQRETSKDTTKQKNKKQKSPSTEGVSTKDTVSAVQKTKTVETKKPVTPILKEIPPQETLHKEKFEHSTTSIKLPQCYYPRFSHSRSVKVLGLSESDAQEFMQDLILQIEEEIPLLKKDVDAGDFHVQEKRTHSLKGSTTNLGTGGIADLLTEYNTYLKTGDNNQVCETYFAFLQKYFSDLKAQYNK